MALATLISFESWDQMRNGYGLSIDYCELAWQELFDRTLPKPS